MKVFFNKVGNFFRRIFGKEKVETEVVFKVEEKSVEVAPQSDPIIESESDPLEENTPETEEEV